MNRYGTFLSMIDKHNLDLGCACGHASSVLVADLIERMPPKSRIADVLPRMRCARCGRRGSVKEVRVYWSDGEPQAPSAE